MKRYVLVLAVLATALSVHISHELIEEHAVLQSLDLAALRQAELAKHNELRALHGCPPLILNDTLNTIAQNYSEYLYSLQGGLTHSSGAKTGQYGENLYWAWGYPSFKYPTAGASVNWYAENQYYDYTTFKSKTAGKAVGHFTAMIWKAATSVGFGFALGDQQGGYGIYITANYNPVTNVVGQYAANVPRPL